MDPHSSTRLDRDGFVRTLRSLLAPNDDIAFVPNLGNAGDGMINAATWQIFERCGVAGAVRRMRPGAGGDVFVHAGGGNLVPGYLNARNSIEHALTLPFTRYVLLPHTIRGNEALLERFDERFHVFCRDLESLAHVRAHAPRAQAWLTDDAALMLDLEPVFAPWPRRLDELHLRCRPKRWRKLTAWRRAIDAIQPTDGELVLMRADVEARDPTGRDPAFDLSGLYGSDFRVRAEARLVTHDFLRVIDRARHIVTDRLHVAIGASLLGKSVELHDNSYGKNRAIFEFSLRGRFPGTVFVPHPTDS